MIVAATRLMHAYASTINDMWRFSFSTCCYHAAIAADYRGNAMVSGQWQGLRAGTAYPLPASKRPSQKSVVRVDLSLEEIMGLIQITGDKTMRFLMALPAPPEVMEKMVPSLELAR